MKPQPPRTVVSERPLEEVIHERDFGALVETQSRTFFRLCNSLAAPGQGPWAKRDFFLLATEAEELETFLDDHGAKFNRTYLMPRELVASVRWHALAAIRACHLEGRFDSYGLRSTLTREEVAEAKESFAALRAFGQSAIEALLRQLRSEMERLAITWVDETAPDEHMLGMTRRRLPRNVGQDDLVDESQRIAEVASKYLAACEMLDELGIRRVTNVDERRRRLSGICKEEQARVYEATVHNLQSTYDTYVKNTVVEGRDERLPRLRGHLSVALHLLEAATFLTHFVERHEVGVRGEAAGLRIGQLVDRARVEELILNHLLYWANTFMQRGLPLAEELLPAYMNMQELHVELPEDVKLHARPAALIVNIVSHHGTPVELVVDGHHCNAGSILELLVAVGSHPDARSFVFRGDLHPLRDIGLLFEHGLGERGIDGLPSELQYLRT